MNTTGVIQDPLFTLPIIKPFPASKERHDLLKFQIQSRRFLGNKHKLLEFIGDIVAEQCGEISSFCDIFAGTGVVGEYLNSEGVKVISNDILNSNFISISAFIGTKKVDLQKIEDKIDLLNNIRAEKDNYFSENFGNTYFSLENARKIGRIREAIDIISENENEKNILITSLIYATDKVANTVGHYDAFRKNLDSVRPIKLLMPEVKLERNQNNEVYRMDANALARKIKCDVLYLDPPYNSRQYCDTYHVLENLASWEKPSVFGKAKKMDRSSLKSRYCFKDAGHAFTDLINNANCKHILVSYNNTGDSKDGRSNARITDETIIRALKDRGEVKIFEREYKAFTTGRSEGVGHTERVFYCRVNR